MESNTNGSGSTDSLPRVETCYRSTLCPDTKSLAMHKGVCEGALISQTRDMCKKTELLPGVLVSHSPLGSQGLAKIDDNWLGLLSCLRHCS
jgi:hypothetical protein